MKPVVRKAISAIRARYAEPITLTELASEVFISPFHFSRVFAKETGVTPGRYLTAVRLFEAKRLLLTTSLTVSDIVCGVGYSSVGTFTSRFTKAVGLTPTQYRSPDVSKLLLALAPEFFFMPSLDDLRGAGAPVGLASSADAVHGRVRFPDGLRGEVLVGLFADPIPQSAPVAFQYLSADGSGQFTIPAVPTGTWYPLAMARAVNGPILLDTPRTPVVVGEGRPTDLRIQLRELDPTDPPIAVTLARRETLGSVRAPRLRAV
ncbi:Transcriptional regulator, AraC family [Alloactinosynnema sp. L-07]|uniref:helix-turn-helix domain-containing protein n=1 Tax=Alloactinosynnema sp. L-07 TaxID=1653480 RepID=UPI00065F0301|nr:helix-turn-helix domain-containing protein [Alloactinosynnema sp. L-07]CRK55071.1 Transcriptional regulator, AraC family [Alloactinosynnema sp. L-07]